MKIKFSEKEIEDILLDYISKKLLDPSKDYKVGVTWRTKIDMKDKVITLIELEVDIT